MTPSDTSKLMAVLQAAYPAFYRDVSNADKKAALRLWDELLRPYPPEIVTFAAKRLISECKFPPAVSEVIERVKEAMCSGEDDATEAWNALHKAASRASVITAAEYGALPYEVRQFCGGMSGLRDLGMLEADKFNTVTRGQFMKTYGVLKRRRETLELMPPELKALIGGTVNSAAGAKQLTEGEWNPQEDEQAARPGPMAAQT